MRAHQGPLLTSPYNRSRWARFAPGLRDRGLAGVWEAGGVLHGGFWAGCRGRWLLACFYNHRIHSFFDAGGKSDFVRGNTFVAGKVHQPPIGGVSPRLSPHLGKTTYHPLSPTFPTYHQTAKK